jgi:hypothetical protein
MAEKLAVMADAPSEYERLSLSPTTIAPWEDGKRTDDFKGAREVIRSRLEVPPTGYTATGELT